MKTTTSLPFGCIALVLAFNLTIGAIASNYTIKAVTGKDVPWWADVAIGVVAGEVVIPASIVLFVLDKTGVIETPLVK